MRLLACLLLVLLAVPVWALDDEEAAAEREAVEAGKRLQAIDEAAERDADHPEVAGEDESEAADALDDVEREPPDPYDDGETAPEPPSRRATQRTPAPEKPPSYPNVLADEGAAGRAGKGPGSKPSPLDAEN